MGLLTLTKKYPKQRVEKAVGIALFFGKLTCKAMKGILEQGIDEEQPSVEKQNQTKKAVLHENIRGQEYYNK
ncbi:MAG TPA: hypothetical protein ENH01_01285 [Nitrospirae bacterium]|nr:hypothetical protein [Nitrospirota bacterium]